MTGLKEHRFEEAILCAKLANGYRRLLASGDCSIRVNEQQVAPLSLPESPSYTATDINAALGDGVKVKGRLWIMDRDRFEGGRGVRLKAGVRTVFNGRLITEGEEFGHYLAGKGPLQRLVGEIEISGLKPNPTKDGWDKSSKGWAAIHAKVNSEMQPFVDLLHQLTDRRAVSRDQRKRANEVRRDIERVIQSLASGKLNGHVEPNSGVAPGGRRAPADTGVGPLDGTVTEDPGATPRMPKTPRTPPPEEAVGILLRRRRTGLPSIEFDALGGADRSQMKTDGQTLVINTDYPLYSEIGETDSYIAETYVLGLLESESGGESASTLISELNRVLSEWHHLRTNVTQATECP